MGKREKMESVKTCVARRWTDRGLRMLRVDTAMVTYKIVITTCYNYTYNHFSLL